MVVLELIANFPPLTLILSSLLAFLIGFWILYAEKHKNLPPGPFGVPILGYFPFLGSKPYEKFDELGKKYGSVFSLYLGQYLTVVLTDYKSVKEAFSKEEFLGKPEHTLFNIIENAAGSFLDISGDVWREQRRFALHIFRDLGMGRAVLEGHILDEISEIVDKFRATKGKPFVTTDLLVPSMSNNVTALVFGERFPSDDPRRKLLDQFLVSEEKGSIHMVSAPIFMPWLMTILKFLGRNNIKSFEVLWANMRNFLRESIAEHEKTLDENNIRDYIDGFLMEMKKKKGGPSSFDEEMLMGNTMLFFAAGSETVQVSVSWLLLLMSVHPDVQSLVQKEIDDVIGNRPPQWKDNTNMPFTNAVIAEMHRWASVVPVNLPRCTLADSTIGGYFIPKGTVIFANFWSLNKDQNMWQNPEKFDPDRFYKKKVESSIPFSYGKRSCPGEGLANIEVFLYFTSFLQNFNISLPDGVKPDFSFFLEVTAFPKWNTFCFSERKK